jgi:hypothetical protein
VSCAIERPGKWLVTIRANRFEPVAAVPFCSLRGVDIVSEAVRGVEVVRHRLQFRGVGDDVGVIRSPVTGQLSRVNINQAGVRGCLSPVGIRTREVRPCLLTRIGVTTIRGWVISRTGCFHGDRGHSDDGRNDKRDRDEENPDPPRPDHTMFCE